MAREVPDELIEQAVRQLQAGEQVEESFRLVMNAFRDLVLGFYRCRGADFSEAEDLTQECFLAVAGSIGNFGWQSPFRVWLLGISANVFRRWLRHKSAHRRRGQTLPLSALQGFPSAQVSTSPDPLRALIRRQQRRLLSQAIRTLPPQMSRCSRLYYLDQRNTREIAERLGLRPATVRVQLHRARFLLASKIAQDGTLTTLSD